MPIVSKETLKGYFEDGKVPNENHYIDFIDTMGDMNKSVYDTNDDGTVNAAASVPWTGITDKPLTYPATTPVADSNALGGIAAANYLQRTSASRPGVTRLYRDDTDSGYYVRHYWTGTHWYLEGYLNGAFHAGCRVEYANTVPWTGITGKPSTYTPSAHTHPGTDITSYVSGADYASDANTVDLLHASQFLRSDVGDTKTGYLHSDSYIDAALGYYINGTHVGNVVLYNPVSFLVHTDWDFGEIKNTGIYTLTRAMYGYPSTARLIYCKYIALGTSATEGYGGLNNDEGYEFYIGSNHDNSHSKRDTGWVRLTDTGGNFYCRLGTTSAYVKIVVMGFSF